MNIDRIDKGIRTNSMLFKIFLNNFDFYINYTYNYNKNSINYDDFLEEFKVGVMYKFYKNWSVLLNFARDLDKNKTREVEASINYSNDCFSTGIKMSGDSYSNSGIGKDTKFGFSFNLKVF